MCPLPSEKKGACPAWPWYGRTTALFPLNIFLFLCANLTLYIRFIWVGTQTNQPTNPSCPERRRPIDPLTSSCPEAQVTPCSHVPPVGNRHYGHCLMRASGVCIKSNICCRPDECGARREFKRGNKNQGSTWTILSIKERPTDRAASRKELHMDVHSAELHSNYL